MVVRIHLLIVIKRCGSVEGGEVHYPVGICGPAGLLRDERKEQKWEGDLDI